MSRVRKGDYLRGVGEVTRITGNGLVIAGGRQFTQTEAGRLVAVVKQGTLVLDRDKVRVVEDVVYGSVFYEDGTVTGLKQAQIHVSPVQPGDKLRFYGGGELREVTGIKRNGINTAFIVTYRPADGDRSEAPEYLLGLDTVKKFLVKEDDVTERPEPRPFPRGSKVRFRNDVIYTAGDWDGELQELVPDDGSETLQFGPDLFELVKGPPIPDGTAVRDLDGNNYLVSRAGDTVVYLTRADSSGFSVDRDVFDASYTLLA